MQEKIIKIDKIDPKDFFGPNDRNIKTIKSNFPNLKIVARGDEIKVYGSSTELSDFEEKIDKLTEKVEELDKKMNLFLERQVKILETLKELKE